MKANGVPEKIYINSNLENRTWLIGKGDISFIEYTRTDILIEKACEFWKDHMAGYDICEDDIERSVESFKLAMTL